MRIMKRRSMLFLAVCTVASAILTVPAYAEEDGWYLNFGAGVNIMSVEFDADPGFRLSAAGGYNFSQYFGLELETGFLYNGQNQEEQEAPEFLGQVPLVISGLLRFENESDWVPYIGFGVGGDLLFSNEDDYGFDLVYQPTAGVRRIINENMSIGARYKYLGYVSAAIFGLSLGNHSIMFELNKTF